MHDSRTIQGVVENIRYTERWWAKQNHVSAFFSFTEKFHAFDTAGRKEVFTTPGSTVLDIGFGTGYFLKKLSTRYSKTVRFCIGMDISLAVVRSFATSAKRYRASALPMDPFDSSLPFKDNSITYVVCSHVLEHVPDDQKLLDEIKRVLSPNGTAMLMVPINEESFTIPNHLRNYTPQSFAETVQKRFTIVSAGQSDCISHWIAATALKKNVLSQIVKKLLIIAGSLLPFGIVRYIDRLFVAAGYKASQTVVVVRKH